ncbi:hypothetical protein HDU88_000943 [Geranomyces variabilis]|nr:hypothetical protein HDU88_000943 [Geranomyces variabilis]
MINNAAEKRTALRLQCALCEQDIVVLKAWYERTKTGATAAASLTAMRAQLEDKVRERKRLIGELQLANANIDALTEAREHFAFATQEQDRLLQESNRLAEFAFATQEQDRLLQESNRLAKFATSDFGALATEAREPSADDSQVQQATRRLGLNDSVDFADFWCRVKALNRLLAHHTPKWFKAFDKLAEVKSEHRKLASSSAPAA